MMDSHFATGQAERRRADDFTVGALAVHGFYVAQHNLSRFKKVVLSTTLLLILSASILMQSLFPLVSAKEYELDATVRALLSESRPDTQKYLAMNREGTAYNFVVPETTEQNSGTSEHTGRVDDAYSASFGIAAKDGVSVTDTASKITATLIPDFYARDAQKVKGDHLVYLNGRNKLVYTLQYNGVKEDIVVPEYSRDELSFDFKLQLPVGVEARLDKAGNIGIFSSDPSLFGNISFGSDEDRARIDKARENGEKTHLLMTIPYPIIKDASGKEYTDRGAFTLGEKITKKRSDNGPEQANLPPEAPRSLININEYGLTITAKQLKGLPYPLSIDPTMVVTAAGDFTGVNNEGGTEVDSTGNLIKRSSLSGGVLDAWQSSFMPENRDWPCVAAYNGYLYVAGGKATGTGPGTGTIRYAAINETTGAPGTYDLLSSTLPVNTSGFCKALVINGRIYYTPDGSNFYFVKINADGTLPNTWTAAGTSGQNYAGVAHYNGYLYFVGHNNGVAQNTVSRTALNADGTFGAIIASTALPGTRYGDSTVVYNGYLYSVGGFGSLADENVYYIKINSDGSLASSWTQASTMQLGKFSGAVYISKGYVYTAGGDSGTGFNDVLYQTEYARINADGSLGVWRYTSDLGTFYHHGFTTYKDFFYTAGGCTNQDPNCNVAGATTTNTVRYTKIKPAGWAEGWTTQTNQFATGRQMFSAVAYDGYLYVAGGCTGNCYNPGQTANNNIEYAPINADGSLGTWTTGPTFGGAGRAGIAMTVYQGYIYVHGGFSIDGLGAHTNYSTLFYSAINSSTGAPAAWQTAANSPGTRAEHDMIAYEGYLYVFGGRNGTTVVDTVSAAPLGSGGNTTASFQSTTPLPTDNARSSIVFAGGRFYVFGGCIVLQGAGSYVCNNAHGDVYYATPGANGTVGAWTTQTDGFGGAIYDYGNVGFTNGMFYVHGGDGPDQMNFVRYASLDSDGSIGSWTTATSLLNLRPDQETVAYGEYFYVIGGAVSRTIDRTLINNGGSGRVNSWSAANATGFSGRYDSQFVATGGKLYQLGGCSQISSNDCTVSWDTVWYTTVNADGTLANWSTTTAAIPLTAGRLRGSVVAYEGRIYMIGGCINTNCSTTTDAIHYATPTASGDITSWTQNDTNPINTTFWTNQEAVAAEGYLYVLGGNATGGLTNQVQYAPFEDDDSLGAFQTTSSFAGARTGHSVTANNGYIYVSGGCDHSALCTNRNPRKNDIQFTQVNTDGTLDAWQYTEHTVPLWNLDAEMQTYNGYLYYSGGWAGDDGGGLSTVFFAPILPDGHLGTWQKAANYATNRNRHGMKIVNGRIYIYGGQGGGGAIENTVEVASPQVIPRIGSFSKRYDFDVGVRPTNLITRGTKQSGATVGVSYASNVACTNTAFDNAQSSSDIGYAGANPLDLILGANRTLARCLFLRYTIDDSLSAVFPDAGNETTITDFDLYYISNPGKRLRGGRTFTNGADRGLNVQP